MNQNQEEEVIKQVRISIQIVSHNFANSHIVGHNDKFKGKLCHLDVNEPKYIFFVNQELLLYNINKFCFNFRNGN